MCDAGIFATILALAVMTTSCSKKDGAHADVTITPAPGVTLAKLDVSSTSFPANGPMPAKLTCEGGDTSPALAWSDPPPTTKSFAIIVDDPDAPDPAAPKTVFVHWVLYNVPPATRALPEGATRAGDGARDGKSDFDQIGWRGPCPPVGRHRYVHKVYALDTVLPDLGEPTKAELAKAMSGHVLAQGELVGTYEKHQR